MSDLILNQTNNKIDYIYNCINDIDIECSKTCTSIIECNQCNCYVIPSDGSGPWGEFMDVLLCLLPIIFLIYATMKKNPFPTTQSLPISAIALLLIRLIYFDNDPILLFSSCISGLLEALTPLSIMAGAILLFETMESTYCLQYIVREMKELTAGHLIAELMLIFAFAQMVEGASGFGTPAALGAPILVSTGMLFYIMYTFICIFVVK